MDRTAIEKIEEMSSATVLEIGGRNYTSKKVFYVTKPTPAPLQIWSLQGMVDYLTSMIDGKSIPDDGLFIHVRTHDDVLLESSIIDNTMQRDVMLEAKFETVNFLFDKYYTVEEMVIKLRTCFVQTEQLADVIKLLGNIKDEAIKTMEDDGISQQVTIKTGIGRVGNVTVPNPVTLKPYRTFYEADQPESDFLLRMKKGDDMPLCALYVADGGTWKQTATTNIKKWLSDKLPSTVIIG